MGELLSDTPSLGAAGCWLASAAIPYSLTPLASVQSSPRLGLSVPHTSVPIAIPETARTDAGTADPLGLVRGDQSWREATCCAATEGVQMSRTLGCEKLCTVQHNSLASKSLCDVVSPPLFVCLMLHRSQREGCTVSSFLPLGPSRLSLAKVNVTF